MSARGRLVKRRIYSAVDTSKIKDKRKENRRIKAGFKKVGGLKTGKVGVFKNAGIGLPSATLKASNVRASDHTFRECIPSNNCLSCTGMLPALVCCEGMHICLTFERSLRTAIIEHVVIAQCGWDNTYH